LKLFFLKNPNKSIGALGLIRKCLTVSPSSRFTVDDIATYWWINVGYKHPPIYYYDTQLKQKDGMMTTSRPPSPLRSNGTTKPRSTVPDQKPKTITTPVSINSNPIPPPPPPPPPPPLSVRLPPPLVQNGHLTDTEVKSKVTKNGYHQIIRPHQLNGNTITPTANNKTKNEILKSNQSSRWTNNNKQNGIIPSSKHPPLRTIVY